MKSYEITCEIWEDVENPDIINYYVVQDIDDGEPKMLAHGVTDSFKGAALRVSEEIRDLFG
jgi:hypothetical protein